MQREGGPKEEIRPDDIVWIPAGEKHWHGATATTAMTHIAIAEALDGKSVDWLEKGKKLPTNNTAPDWPVRTRSEPTKPVELSPAECRPITPAYLKGEHRRNADTPLRIK